MGRLPRAGDLREIVCDYARWVRRRRGVSRASIPDGILTTYTDEFGYAWLAALAVAP